MLEEQRSENLSRVHDLIARLAINVSRRPTVGSLLRVAIPRRCGQASEAQASTHSERAEVSTNVFRHPATEGK